MPFLQRTAFGILLFVLALSPVFFGSVHVWAYCVFGLMVMAATGLVLATEGLSSIRGRRENFFRYWQTPVDGCVALFACIFLLQLLPWPDWVIEICSPRLADLQEQVAVITGQDFGATLSAVPRATKISAILFIAYAAMFYGLVRLLQTRYRLKILASAILVVGLAITLYGLAEKLSGHNHILWWPHAYIPKQNFRVFGTFINPDHMGFYLEMIVCVGLGYLYAVHQPRQLKSKAGGWQRFKAALVAYAGDDQWQKKMLLLFFVAIMLCTLILTGSRGAIFSCAAGILFFFWAVYWRQEKKRAGFILVVLLFLTLIFAGRAGLMPVWQRFAKLTPENVITHWRVKHNLAALDMWADYPVFGSGMGTFEAVYPAYQPIKDKRLRTHLHCDWLQTALEAGLLGLLIVGSGYVLLLKNLWRGIMRRRDRLVVGLGLGAMSALVCAGVHSLFDFGLRMPANAWTLAAVAALGVGGLKRCVFR